MWQAITRGLPFFHSRASLSVLWYTSCCILCSQFQSELIRKGDRDVCSDRYGMDHKSAWQPLAYAARRQPRRWGLEYGGYFLCALPPERRLLPGLESHGLFRVGSSGLWGRRIPVPRPGRIPEVAETGRYHLLVASGGQWSIQYVHQDSTTSCSTTLLWWRKLRLTIRTLCSRWVDESAYLPGGKSWYIFSQGLYSVLSVGFSSRTNTRILLFFTPLIRKYG